ncbi:hypothetical protein ACTFIW_002501 [Dictyostelium discoideum]
MQLFVDYNGFVLEKKLNNWDDYEKPIIGKKGTCTDFAYLLNGLVIIDKANSCQQPDVYSLLCKTIIQIYDRDLSTSGNYKVCSIQRNISTVDQTSIISFGSQQLTVGDFNKSHNSTPITGTFA